MKKWKCDMCHKETEVYDEYEAEFCYSGYDCGCYGKPTNPVFCDACDKSLGICSNCKQDCKFDTDSKDNCKYHKKQV
jgi:hypothetical protein